jgi:hypothetical protein
MAGAKLRPLSEKEKERFLEIKFYIFVKELLKNQLGSTPYDTISNLAQAFGCSEAVMRGLIQQIYLNTSKIIPSKYEMSILYYRAKKSIRTMGRDFGLHQNTIYANIEHYISEGCPPLVKKSEENIYKEIDIFMRKMYNVYEAYKVGEVE